MKIKPFEPGKFTSQIGWVKENGRDPQNGLEAHPIAKIVWLSHTRAFLRIFSSVLTIEAAECVLNY